ncbi:MAG: precorrin-2 C(20)-methyltransferase [Desulfobacteraceae bacterium]|nr:precorrin-2 C(20)-methyltransferase [Desulfobacteraceae bacterium]
MKTGTLYGIGVGPGDPELITLKAVNILKKTDIVFSASSTKNDFSIAKNIAADHIPANTQMVDLSFPMTKDKEILQKTWHEHACTIASELDQRKNGVFLTLGDPLVYSTYGYILISLKNNFPHIPIETVPGITSYQAAASRINTPLVQGNESLLLTACTKGPEHIKTLGETIENVVLLKAYKNIKEICSALEENNMADNTVTVRKCGLADEEIIRDIRNLNNKPPEYWTLIMAKRKKADLASDPYSGI